MVAEALVLGDGGAALRERVVHVVEGGKVEAEAALARRERKVSKGMTERGTVASGRRSSQAPEPTCEWLMREVASRCGTVAPAFCESKESHASLAILCIWTWAENTVYFVYLLPQSQDTPYTLDH